MSRTTGMSRETDTFQSLVTTCACCAEGILIWRGPSDIAGATEQQCQRCGKLNVLTSVTAYLSYRDE